MSKDVSFPRQVASQLPKSQLHLHLDGSLAESFIATRAAARNISLPVPASELRQHLISQKQRALSTNTHTQARNQNWDVFTFCNQFLQTYEELHQATRILVATLLSHNVWLAEIRFCPALHTLERLSEHDAIQAVTDGFSSAAASATHPFRGGIILAALRSYDTQHVAHTCRLAAKWLSRGVIAVDLAGDEGRYPLQEHMSALKLASELGVPLTIHAGEWRQRAEQNVQNALLLGARRLGHALVLGRDEQLCRKVREAGVAVETCLTANCNSETKVPPGRFDLHPIGEMLRQGVKVAAFSCDNLLLSGTMEHRPDPTAEIVRAKIGCGLSWKQIREVLVEGVRASFVVSSGDPFLRRFEKAVDDVFNSLSVYV